MEDFIVSNAFDGKRRKLYRGNCATCGNIFYAPKHAQQKYCSDRCYRAKPSTLVAKICDNCGEEFLRRRSSLPKSKSGLFFCKRKCKDEAQRMGKHNSILRPRSHKDGRSSYRVIAFRNHPPRCNRCGYDECIGILKVHHRDRNRHNNVPENLEILCPNCHELEHFSKKDGSFSGGRKKKSGAVFGNGNLLLLHSGDVSSTLTGSTNI